MRITLDTESHNAEGSYLLRVVDLAGHGVSVRVFGNEYALNRLRTALAEKDADYERLGQRFAAFMDGMTRALGFPGGDGETLQQAAERLSKLAEECRSLNIAPNKHGLQQALASARDAGAKDMQDRAVALCRDMARDDCSAAYAGTEIARLPVESPRSLATQEGEHRR